MTAVPVEVEAPPVDSRRRFILIATIIGSSMTFIDGTVVNIALPTIGRDLDAGLSAQQWVMLSVLAVASLYIVAVHWVTATGGGCCSCGEWGDSRPPRRSPGWRRTP